jgi:hypothetical protein
MKLWRKTKWYYCRHCNTRFKDPSMAQICFDLDMKMLKSGSPTAIAQAFDKKGILVKKA